MTVTVLTGLTWSHNSSSSYVHIPNCHLSDDVSCSRPALRAESQTVKSQLSLFRCLPVWTDTVIFWWGYVIQLQCSDQESPLKHRKSPYFCFTALLWPHVCVYVSAAQILCACARAGPAFSGGGGGYSTTGPTNPLTGRSPEGST